MKKVTSLLSDFGRSVNKMPKKEVPEIDFGSDIELVDVEPEVTVGKWKMAVETTNERLEAAAKEQRKSSIRLGTRPRMSTKTAIDRSWMTPEWIGKKGKKVKRPKSPGGLKGRARMAEIKREKAEKNSLYARPVVIDERDMERMNFYRLMAVCFGKESV